MPFLLKLILVIGEKKHRRYINRLLQLSKRKQGKRFGNLVLACNQMIINRLANNQVLLFLFCTLGGCIEVEHYSQEKGYPTGGIPFLKATETDTKALAAQYAAADR